MTLATERRPEAPAQDAASGTSRGAWWAGWRVALRLARRDVRRHAGRSALVVVMVAVPVLLLVAGHVLLRTGDIDAVEALPYTLGQSQARVSFEGRGFVPLPGGWAGAYRDGEPDQPTPIPGWSDRLVDQVGALSTLLHGRVAPVTTEDWSVRVGGRTRSAAVLGVDVAGFPDTEGLAHLLSGRWPTTPTEVAVTPTGVARGLPQEGTIEASDPATGEAIGAVTVVGVAEGWDGRYGNPHAVDLVTLPAERGPAQRSFLLSRSTGVPWAEVRAMAAYGLSVHSRQVVLDPPTRAELGAVDGIGDSDDGGRAAEVVAETVVAIGLLLETCLLVGPAFAVSAARSRRVLALAASNGATTAQLRRTVLAQALVLGALAAAVGTVLGLLAAGVTVAVVRARDPGSLFGPFDVPVGSLALVLGCAVASAIVAAAIPARGLGRLDIVGVMRGQSVSPPARRHVPVVGVVLFALGAVLVFVAVSLGGENAYLVIPPLTLVGGILLVVGALMLAPMALVGTARLVRSAPVAVRMAARDAVRARGRATSTVAAILGGACLLTGVVVIAASDSAFRAATYDPQLPDGLAMVRVAGRGPGPASSTSAQAAAEAVRASAPRVHVDRLDRVVASASWTAKSAATPTGEQFLVAARTGCSVPELLDGDWSHPCATLSGSWGNQHTSIVVASAESLTRLFGLDAEARAMVERGGILVHDAPQHRYDSSGPDGRGRVLWQGSEVEIVDGHVTFLRGTSRYAEQGPVLVGDVSTQSVPAARVPAATLDRVFPDRTVGALLTPETAATLAWPTSLDRLLLSDPRGPISPDDESAIRTATEQSGTGWLYVERGFQPYDTVLRWVVVAVVGLLILVATLVATALSTAETQPLLGTLAAVGATRRTRRNVAAAQAALLAFLGSLLGVLVGLVPGIAVARRITAVYIPRGFSDYSPFETSARPLEPTVVIPWLQLAVPLLLVPAVAAALAWLAIRTAPAVTRRPT